MKTELVLTPEARADIIEVGAWYRDRSMLAAESFLTALRATFDKIASHSTAHVVIDSATGARRALLKKFPQRVLYLFEPERVVVFAVMHHRRDDPEWQQRLR